MPKTTIREKISQSIVSIKEIISSKPKVKPKNKVEKKSRKPLLTKANINKVRKLVGNPIVQQIGLKLLDLASPNKLTIYTHNICWTQPKANHIRIAKKLETLQPDIICLQEVVFQAQSEIFNLSHYHKSISQDSGKRIVKGGLAIYSKVKPICVNFIKFEKQGKIFSPQLAERQLEKGFLVAEFKDYLIINTHLVADQSKKWTETKLKHTNAQFDQLLEFINMTGKTKPIFVVGDLNFCPTNQSYEKALNSNLIDVTAKLPYTYIDKKTKLDYIWSAQSVKNSKARRIRFTHQEPSDHLAVLSQIVY